jgi:hypothetical protein
MRAKVWVCLILLGVVALTPLAYASPPDPSWIRGLYDGGDFDDIVVLLTGGTGIVEPFPLHAVCPRLVAAGSALSTDDGVRPSACPSFKRPRGPPFR